MKCITDWARETIGAMGVGKPSSLHDKIREIQAEAVEECVQHLQKEAMMYNAAAEQNDGTLDAAARNLRGQASTLYTLAGELRQIKWPKDRPKDRPKEEPNDQD